MSSDFRTKSVRFTQLAAVVYLIAMVITIVPFFNVSIPKYKFYLLLGSGMIYLPYTFKMTLNYREERDKDE